MSDMAPVELRAARERTVREHVEAERRHDVEGALATFADPNYDVIALGEPATGLTAVQEYLTGLFTAMPDLDVDIRSVHHADEIVFLDVLISGTHSGPLAGTPATGRHVAFRAGCVFHFESSDLVKETVYFDSGTMLRDMGLLPAKGGRAERAMLGMMSLMVRARDSLRGSRAATPTTG